MFNNKPIVIIDDPELGLNPLAKQEFLKFLIGESQNKQIFIATQDPTFVNPVLLGKGKVSIYLYSVYDDAFRKINMTQNEEDPNSFAGYLPHTVSLKGIHIYVEGPSDVYIFQIWLEKFMKEKSPDNWFKILNKVGIFHLEGDNWKYLLYTIPKKPYKCIVILDGDKRKDAENTCEKYNNSKANTARFEYCVDLETVRNVFREENKYRDNKRHPIYCLEEECIEKYLFPEHTNIPANFQKTKKGPEIAQKVLISQEIMELFDVILEEN